MGVIILDFIPLKNNGENGVRKISLQTDDNNFYQETIHGCQRKKEFYFEHQECRRNIEIQSL